MNRKIHKFFAFALIVSTLSLSTSCTKTEGCTDPTAENYDPEAELENNTCVTQRQKFLGLYLANGLCSLGSGSQQQGYYVEVRKSNQNLYDILLFNVGNLFNNPVVATVNRTLITIERQDPDAVGRYISGTGSIVGTEITLSYKIRDGSNVYDCIWNLEK
jgi:hypothetical protein